MHNNFLAVVGITILFLGVVVTPMTLGYDVSIHEKEILTKVSGLPIADDNTHYMGDSREYDCIKFLDAVDSSEILFSNGKTAYAFIVYGNSSGYPNGPCYFALDDPVNITSITSSEPFISGGTWTTDDRWFGCLYGSGVLFEIYPKTGDVVSIGGGGIGCHGLAWDPVYNRLYGTTGSQLVEYNPNNGEQTVIGNHSINQTLIALAIDLGGVCYAWDVKFEGNAILYKIDLESGEATEVGDIGINLLYAQDGAFDWDTGILYLSAYSNTTGFLATCDVDTAELTVIGDFEGGAELDALAIPCDWSGVPHADFTWTPIHPNPDEIILFNASKSIDYHGYITLYEWDWDNDGVFDENHTNPTAKHSWPNYEYYPVTLRVTDNSSITGMRTKTVRVGFRPPESLIINGTSRGKPMKYYNYTFITNDPDGDDVKYFIDWYSDGDGDWTDWYASGEELILRHLWPEAGTFTISAMVKDRCGFESNWSKYLVDIQKNRATTYLWYQWLFERFPSLEKLLKLIRAI